MQDIVPSILHQYNYAVRIVLIQLQKAEHF